MAELEEIFDVEVVEKAENRWDKVVDDIFNTDFKPAVGKILKYPIDLQVLLDASIMNPYHKRALVAKRLATIGSGYTIADGGNPEDRAKLQAVANVFFKQTLEAFADDYFTFANAYLEPEKNVNGRTVRLHHARANTIWKTPAGGWAQRVIEPGAEKEKWVPIPKNKLLHMKAYSPLSDHYGVPDYIAALLQILLSHETDDFHRKFYKNGAHVGAFNVLKGVSLTFDQKESLKSKIKSTKGEGHFTDVLLVLKNANADFEVIEGSAKKTVKDDYPQIKINTREGIITAHGMPPRLMSIILDAKSGAMAGQLTEEMDLFNLVFVEPMQLTFEEFLNPHLPHPIKFKPFLLSRTSEDAGADKGEAEETDESEEEAPEETEA